MDEHEQHEWEKCLEFHPFYRMWADIPMDYSEYRARRDAEDESRRWGLPEVWE